MSRTAITKLGIGLVVLGIGLGVYCLAWLFFTDWFMPPIVSMGPVPAAYASRRFSVKMTCPNEWAAGQSAPIQVTISNLQDTTLTYTLRFQLNGQSAPIMLKTTVPAHQSTALVSPAIFPSAVDITYETVSLSVDVQDASGQAVRETNSPGGGCQVKVSTVMARKAGQLKLLGGSGLLCMILGLTVWFYVNGPLKPWPKRFKAAAVGSLVIVFEVVVWLAIFKTLSVASLNGP